MEEKRKPFLVFSVNVVKYLQELGFKFFAVKQDRNDPKKTIFIYTDTDELRKAVVDYKNK